MLLLYEIASRRWLTSYRADALTLKASTQFSVLSPQQEIAAELPKCRQLRADENIFNGRKITHNSSVLLRDRSRNIDYRQQHEHVCLQNRDYNMKPAEDDGHANRNHGKENQSDQIPGKNIGPKTDCE
jgi:hypothetical protein